MISYYDFFFIEGDKVGSKRRFAWKPTPPAKRPKTPAYFIPELAHVVALCDERMPFVTLAQEVGSNFCVSLSIECFKRFL